ncbi:MAG: ABC transporter substrate-binding protein [Xanthobacteraceae bacterium]
MRRRQVIILLGGAAAAWPIAPRAQQHPLPVIGFLNTGSPDAFAGRVRAFHEGLAAAGYVEGRNVAVDYRWANDMFERVPQLAAELVRRRVAVIAAGGTQTALAAKAASSDTPIVFQTVTDPVELGLVASLNQPGGNLTGVATLGLEVGSKQLEVLHQTVPSATTIGVLVNPTFPTSERVSHAMQTAAGKLRLQLDLVHAAEAREFEAVFDSLRDKQAGGLVIMTNPLFTNRRARLAELALRYGVPAIYQYREFPSAGGLMSYGASFTESYRLVGTYVGRILNGDPPGSLPVLQPTRFELVINVQTAKALGLTIPDRLLALADEVME